MGDESERMLSQTAAAQQQQQQQHGGGMDRDAHGEVPVAVPYQAGMTTFKGLEGTPDDLFSVLGSEYSQLLEVHLAPGSVLSAEPGTMIHASEWLNPVADMGDCGQACTRACCAGESFFRLNFTNKANQYASVGLSPAFPGRIIPIDMRARGSMMFRSGSFVAAIGKDWRVRIRMVRSVGAACLGGQGVFLNELTGGTWAFITGGGTVLEKHLQAGETLLVDTASVVAFEPSVTFDIRLVRNCLTCCVGGMGLANAVLTGPGLVYIDTMSKDKFMRNIPRGGGSGGGGNNGNNGGGGGDFGGGGGGGGM